MAINTHTTGFGTLAGIAWTPLDGTGLSPAETVSVDKDVKAASVMATALLAATKSAFNRDWVQFSLNDLAGLGHLSTLATGDNTAAQWATFIGRAVGSAPATSHARSLGEWRRLAADLQQYAALQASKLDAGRDPSLGAAGGVTHANGQWYANGQALSLLDLFTAARVNQAANHDDTLDGLVGEIQANSRRISAAREWASMIRRHLPSGTAAGPGLPADRRNEFMAKWGFDPYTTFHKTQPESGSVYPQKFDQWLTDVKTYIDDQDSENRKLQNVVEQKNNRRSEVLEAMVTFATSQSKTGNAMANSLA